MLIRASVWALVCLALLPAAAFAQTNNTCEAGEEPDIIVGALTGRTRHGTSNGITAFSIGTDSCNVGTCWVNWISGSPGNHPVIGQNMFRLKDGRFEHIGQSWLKHGFAALNGSLCSTNCIPADGSHLGVNCSDPYSSGLNGSQGSLGPKAEVNPTTGVHLHPYTAQGATGSSIYKRLQVQNVDLDPALNPGAQYFVEGQYVAADDAAAGNHRNNHAWRRINVSGSGTTFDISLTGGTVREPGLMAWSAADPTVHVADLWDYLGGAKVTDLGNGRWRYTWALQNMFSHDAARALHIPVPHGATITNFYFHDVDYHSGEPYSGTDWQVQMTTNGIHEVVWSTQTFEENPNANALRWGTMYTFGFDIDAPPVEAKASFAAFRPGGSHGTWSTLVPDRCGDAFCDLDENESSCEVDCAFAGTAGAVPATGDGMLRLARATGSELTLTWGESCWVSDSTYAVYAGTIGDFTSHEIVTCSTFGATELTLDPDGGSRYYLIVPVSGEREGSYGQTSSGAERPQALRPCKSQSVQSCP